MTQISRYIIDTKVTGSDKWIGSDSETQNTTKNFTPNKLSVYFNENQVIDIGTPIRYRYDILEPLDDRLPGTITFDPQVGTPYNFSSITNFILSKYTLKGNDVSEYLDFLVGKKVLISKADDVNIFGYYELTSLVQNLLELNFFDVTLSYITGNGSIVEDKDYLISLVDGSGGTVPTRTSDLINDGEDGVHPFITLQDIVSPSLQDVVNTGNGISNFGGIGIASIQSTNFTNNRTLYLNNNSFPTIKLVDNANASHNLTIDLDTLSLNGVSYNWSSIVSTSGYVPYVGATSSVTLGAYSISGNQSTFNKYLFNDNTDPYIGSIYLSGEEFFIYTSSTDLLIRTTYGELNLRGYDPSTFVPRTAKLTYQSLTADRAYALPNASGTIALTSDITGFVPYTGATNNLDIGVYSVISDDGITNSEMSPSYFAVQNSNAAIYGLLEYNQLTMLNLAGSIGITASGITFPNASIQTTAFPPTGGTTSQYIRGNGTLATFPTIPSITNLVPYTGANADVDLGTNDLYLNKLWLYDEPNDNHGSIHFTDSDFHIEDADGHKMLVIEDGFMQIHLSDTIQSNLYTSNLTQTRDHYLPNQSGTIALTSDLSSYVPTTRTINAKQLSSNVVLNTSDIADSTNKRYQTDSQQSFNDATSSIQTQLNAKQSTLVSGTNIKSINGNSILGSGDLAVKGIHALITPYSGLTVSASINASGISGSYVGITNRLTAYPFIPAQTITCSSLYINVTFLGVGTLAQILIYSDLNGKPDAKIYQSTDLDCSTIGKKTVTTTQTFTAGNVYWIGVQTSGIQSLTSITAAGLITPYIVTVSPGTSYFITPAYGSAPNPFGSPSNSTGSVPFIGITI